MNRTRSIALSLVVFLAASAVLMLPGTVAAAPTQSSVHNTVIVDAPIQPTFAIPGIFSLKFGDDVSTSELDIPALNATAIIDGLTLGPVLGWNSIILNQKQPAVTAAGLISGGQATVGGPQTGYSANATAQVELHPGPGLQAEGTVGIVYDGMSRSAGVMLKDAAMKMPTWPVGLDLSGINTGQGTLTIASAEVGLPVIASAMKVNNFRTGNTGTGWDSLTLAQSSDAPLTIGTAATISGIQLNLPQAGEEQDLALSAQVALHPGPGLRAEGTVGVVRDDATRSAGLMIQDGSVSVPTWPVGIEVTGINTGQGTITMDSAQVGIPVAGSAVTMTGLSVGSGGTSWDSLTFAQSSDAPLKIGTAATISGMQLNLPQAGEEQDLALTAQVALHPGPGLQAEGTVGVVRDDATQSAGLMIQDGSVSVPTWPVGLEVTGINTGQGTITMDSAQVGIPVAGSAVTVNGLSVGSGGTRWDSLTLAQNPDAPVKLGNLATISEIELNVPTPGSEQGASGSAQVEVSPGPGFQAEGTVTVGHDEASGSRGVRLQNGSVTVPTWPVGASVTGINTGPEGLTIDSAQLTLPVAGSAVTVEGFQAGSGGTNWDSLAFAQSPDAPIKIGNVGTISGIELSVPTAGQEEPTTLSADFAFNAGDIASVEGELIGVRDSSGGQSGVALKDTVATVQIPGWGLQLAGINSVQGGVKIDQVTFTGEPIDLTAELTGVTVGAGGGMTFDEAKVTGGDGFEMTMTKTDSGYILTTTSVLPVAAR